MGVKSLVPTPHTLFGLNWNYTRAYSHRLSCITTAVRRQLKIEPYVLITLQGSHRALNQPGHSRRLEDNKVVRTLTMSEALPCSPPCCCWAELVSTETCVCDS